VLAIIASLLLIAVIALQVGELSFYKAPTSVWPL
jgi:hypothetical protein